MRQYFVRAVAGVAVLSIGAMFVTTNVSLAQSNKFKQGIDDVRSGIGSQLVSGTDPKAKTLDVIQQVTRFLLSLVGSLTLLAMVIGSIKIILAAGDDSKVASGKKIIFMALAGLVITLFAVIITEAVYKLLRSGLA